MKFHKDGTQPTNKAAVFVFGSNLAGRHGAGAARAAYEHYGARMGVGVGIMGKSYALPTKDENIETLPLRIISNEVTRFLQVARAHPTLEFFITRVGCVLAGYSDAEIAPLFKNAPPNCDFPEEWKPYIT
jgi:hypothetical protein